MALKVVWLLGIKSYILNSILKSYYFSKIKYQQLNLDCQESLFRKTERKIERDRERER